MRGKKDLVRTLLNGSKDVVHPQNDPLSPQSYTSIRKTFRKKNQSSNMQDTNSHPNQNQTSKHKKKIPFNPSLDLPTFIYIRASAD